MKTNLEFPDNVSLNFNANGVEVRVSLNIPKELKSYVSPNNLFKGEHHYVYALRNFIPSHLISKKSLEEMRNVLLKTAMGNIRAMKSVYLQNESNKIKKSLC